MAVIRIAIREARIGDLGVIVDLWQQMIEHHTRLSPHFTLAEDGKEKFSKYLAKKFSEKSTRLIVAEHDGKVVGFMLGLLSPNVPVFKERTMGVISDVYVLPGYRKRGISREMLKGVLKWFNKNKVTTVQLNVATANLEARSAWGQLGFKPYMIMNRMELDKYPARQMISEEPKAIRKKVVKRVQKDKGKR